MYISEKKAFLYSCNFLNEVTLRYKIFAKSNKFLKDSISIQKRRYGSNSNSRRYNKFVY